MRMLESHPHPAEPRVVFQGWSGAFQEPLRLRLYWKNDHGWLGGGWAQGTRNLRRSNAKAGRWGGGAVSLRNRAGATDWGPYLLVAETGLSGGSCYISGEAQ